MLGADALFPRARLTTLFQPATAAERLQHVGAQPKTCIFLSFNDLPRVSSRRAQQKSLKTKLLSPISGLTQPLPVAYLFSGQ